MGGFLINIQVGAEEGQRRGGKGVGGEGGGLCESKGVFDVPFFSFLFLFTFDIIFYNFVSLFSVCVLFLYLSLFVSPFAR